MLKRETRAKALCFAMKAKIEGYESPAYYKFVKKIQKSRNYKFKADLLNFLKGTSPMTQRLYLQLLKDMDNEHIGKINKYVAFKNLVEILKNTLKNAIFSQEMFEFCFFSLLLYGFMRDLIA